MASGSGQTQCYYPDGSKATNYKYVPCTNDTFSACCYPGEGDICQTNGLCWWPGGGSLYRASCTDPTWQSPNCPQVCKDTSPSNWVIATPCDNNGTWACNSGSTCPSGIFTGFSIQKTSTGVTASSSVKATTIVSISRTTESVIVFSTLPIASPTSTSSLATEGSAILPTSTSPPAPSSATLSSGAIAGIVVGSVAVIGVTVVLAIWLVLSWRRKQNGTSKGQVETSGGEHMPVPVYPDTMIKGPLEPQVLQQPAEMHAVSYVPEMDGKGVGG